MNDQNTSLETLQDIKRMMERSSRFISLSGLSGVSAGTFALIGAYTAHQWLGGYGYAGNDNHAESFHVLIWKLFF